MKKNFYTLVSLSILTALYSQSSFASLKNYCLAGVPHFSGELVQGELNDLPVYIEANMAEATPHTAKYTGNVEIRQGNRYLSAETLQLNQEVTQQRTAIAPNGFRYSDTQIQFSGKDASINLNNKHSAVREANYHFVNRQGRGTAQHIQTNARERLMKNATFTSCLQNDDAWSIDAAEIRQDIQGEYAEMWHARFKVYGVPVFYTPYWQLPIGDRPRSGLLLPRAGASSRHGYYYAQPIYWHIAPNTDFTFTPKYMSKRGWQFNGEFRYLTNIGEGTIAGEYMHNDRLKTYLGKDRSRHLFYWKHSSSFLDNWRLELDYTRVSDPYYFTDFSSGYGNSTDGYANQYARIAYYQPHYNVALSMRQFQLFDDINTGPYRTLPQFDVNYYQNNLAGLVDFSLFAQAVRFENKNPVMPKAWRFHLEPSLNFPFSNRYGSLNIETKLYATKYRQYQGKDPSAEWVKSSISRVLPQIKVDLQTLLTSKRTFIHGYTQTLEPHIQYLYRTYKNQSDIGSSINNDYLGFGYDSSLLQQDYLALFRDRRYAGLDRIASANQFTLGATTRFYDETGDERFNLSAGQIYYIQPSRIDEDKNNSTYGHSSSWSLEANWKINSHWAWRGSYQYDTRLNEVVLTNFAAEYRPSGNNLLQLNYRYVNEKYIDQNLSGGKGYAQDIKQLGLITAWELNQNWSFVARYYQDLGRDKPVEQYLGIEYQTCCWAVNVGAHRNVTHRVTQKSNTFVYDKGFSLNFELRGLSPSSHQNNIEKMLRTGKLPYLQAFSLY